MACQERQESEGGGMTVAQYSCILADPPWAYRVYDKSTNHDVRGLASRHYPTMGLEAIKALPVGDMASRDAALFLWVTMPCLPDGIDVMRAWGFTYKTCAFSWVKLTKGGKPSFGVGHYTRSNTELCLLGTKGRIRRRDALDARNVEQVILSARRQHSRKPDAVYERIERLFDGPKVELFARQQWPGWDTAYSHEIGKFGEATA